jgi:hypothetical protein
LIATNIKYIQRDSKLHISSPINQNKEIPVQINQLDNDVPNYSLKSGRLLAENLQSLKSALVLLMIPGILIFGLNE